MLPEKGLWLITGPSGSGKSTLLSLIKGLCPSYIPGYFEGQIHYKEQLIDKSFVQQKKNEIVYLFQNPYQQIIYQNSHLEFCFSAESQLIAYNDFKLSSEILSDLFNLSTILKKKTSELSLGQAQKLLLASLLASEPKVLLLDEPTAFLDKKAREAFYSLLSRLRKDYLVILVDHHIAEVKNTCDGFLQVSQQGEVTRLKELLQTAKKRAGLQKHLNFEKISHVKLQNVNYSYDRNKNTLNKINFTAQSPDIVALKGENGAGKTTLLKILSGYLKPQSGTASSSKDIGYVMQNPDDNFIFDTAKQELAGVDKELVYRFFPQKNLEVSPFSLSEGEKRRLSFLIHLKKHKKVILYDEPTFGLDDHNRQLVVETLIQFKSYNILQIIVSHDDELIAQVADHIYELKAGQLEKV
jgi:energy-coupling factor transport system ATP-binding protein